MDMFAKQPPQRDRVVGRRDELRRGHCPQRSRQRLVRARTLDTRVEVLLGDLTYRLVRQSVEAEPVEPLELKGKSEPVPAYRLVSLHDVEDVLRSRGEAPMVGRDEQLRTLADAFREAVAARECRVVLLAELFLELVGE